MEQNKYDDLFFEADNMIADKNYSGAMQNLEAILADAPDYGKAYNHLGWIMETRYKDYARAEEFYKKCLVYSPEYVPIYLNLSILLSTLGKYEEQQALLEKALQTPGTDKAAMYNELALMHELKGDYLEAIRQFKMAVRHSMSDSNMDIYVRSMERCRKKMQVLGENQ